MKIYDTPNSSMSSENLAAQFSNTKPGDVGIIGDPVQHSLSPLIQNAAFKTWWGAFRDRDEKTPEYHKFYVKSEDLEKAIKLAKKHGLRGLNVTVPHKEKVCRFIDEFDPFAKKLGSVNTISFLKPSSRGFNTDGDGFRRAVERDLNFDMDGKAALVLGAGGTGRVIAAELIEMNASKIMVWNRTPARLKNLLAGADFETNQIESLSDESDAVRASEKADFIVNATSVGLNSSDGLPVKGIKFKPTQTVFDVIYHHDTAFLKEARAAGAKAFGGKAMFLYQGAKAFEIWSGGPAPYDVMRTTLEQFLGGK